jgi:hypothetical protein
MELVFIFVAGLLISLGCIGYKKATINDEILRNTKCFEQTQDKKCWDLK